MTLAVTGICAAAALDATIISATPLPASWTMMLVELAGFGFVAAYRRRKKGSAALAAA